MSVVVGSSGGVILLRVCCTIVESGIVWSDLPLSLSAYRLWMSVLDVSGTTSRRPVPNSTTRVVVAIGLAVLPAGALAGIAHCGASGRVVIGFLSPAVAIMMTSIAPDVLVMSKRHIWPRLSPP